MTDVGDGQMADDGGQCFETTVRWDSLKELDPFMGSELANEKLTVTMGYIYLSLKLLARLGKYPPLFTSTSVNSC